MAEVILVGCPGGLTPCQMEACHQSIPDFMLMYGAASTLHKHTGTIGTPDACAISVSLDHPGRVLGSSSHLAAARRLRHSPRLKVVRALLPAEPAQRPPSQPVGHQIPVSAPTVIPCSPSSLSHPLQVLVFSLDTDSVHTSVLQCYSKVQSEAQLHCKSEMQVAILTRPHLCNRMPAPSKSQHDDCRDQHYNC